MLANSDWVINFGTLILAAAAIVSAWISVVSLRSSRNVLDAATTQSKATVELVDIARAELTASYLPLLAGVRQHDQALVDDVDHFTTVTKLGNGLRVTIPIRNVGPGPAFLKFAVLQSIDGITFHAPAVTSQQVIVSGETTLVVSGSPNNDPSFQSQFEELINGPFRAVVRYSDFTGSRRRQTILYIAARIGDHRFIRDVEVHECDENWNITGGPVLTHRDSDVTPTPSD